MRPPHPRRLRRLLRDQRGVAAVEFAVILPLMILFYVGVIDVTRAVIASRKLNYLSRSISDLVSQQPTSGPVPIATMSNILTTSTAIMKPYSLTGLTMTVSAVDIRVKSDKKTCCDAVVRWTYTQGGTLRACGSAPGGSGGAVLTQVANGARPTPTTIPAAMVTANQSAGYGYTSGQTSYLVITDVAYTYQPLFSSAESYLGRIFGQSTNWFAQGMSKTTYMVPRSANGAVTIADPSSAPSGQNGTICFN